MGNGGLSGRRSGRVQQNPGTRIGPSSSSSSSGSFHYPPAAWSMSMREAAVEHRKASTIRNDVNLKKSSLHLEEDHLNPGFYLVAFSFDATMPGRICIFFHTKEGHDCSLYSLKPHLYNPSQVSFEKGLDQKFRQASGTGVDLSLFDETDLLKEGPGEVYPLVIRAETQPSDVATSENKAAGTPLPKWVRAQMTYAVLEARDGAHHVKVVKQMIWVDGIRYELQEIYGIENSENYGLDGNDTGKECIICMSEPRDTTVLPCRHMCMCSGCAKVLRYQTRRCPICRTPVEKLLEIIVPKHEGEHGDEKDGFSTITTGSTELV